MATKNSIYFMLLSIIFGLASCEGSEQGKGIIYDIATMQPLDSVNCVNKTDSERSTYSDSTGHYYMGNPTKSCIGGCAPIIIEFSKPGYISITIKNPGESAIYLKPE